MKALIIGATGATGKDLVNVLLADSAYTTVVTFVRRSSGVVHEKLQEVLVDFDHPGEAAGSIQGDVLFSLLGTTLKAAGSKEKQRQIDYDIPLRFAALARAGGVQTCVLLSAYGASAGSRVFYSRLKGELEEAIEKIGFKRYIIFRPGLLLRKDTDRWGEKISGKILQLLNRIGVAVRFRPMPTAVLAEKMSKAAVLFPSGRQVVELEKISGV